jgi:hypothetical protein
MTDSDVQHVLESSREHAADLLEAADFMRAMLMKRPLAETLDHYEALAARLQARGKAIAENVGELL